MKKKVLSILLAALMIVSILPTVAFAEEPQNSGSATIKVTVPDQTKYTIHIPSDTTLIYNTMNMQFLTGSVYITDVSGLGEDKNVVCTVMAEDLKNGENTLSTNYYYGTDLTDFTDKSCSFACGIGQSNGTVIKAQVTDWSKAVAGDYTATLTFQFAVADKPTE